MSRTQSSHTQSTRALALASAAASAGETTTPRFCRDCVSYRQVAAAEWRKGHSRHECLNPQCADPVTGAPGDCESLRGSSLNDSPCKRSGLLFEQRLADVNAGFVDPLA